LERLTPGAPLRWTVARVTAMRRDTGSAGTLVLEVPGWPGHLAGQHVDVRLTAEDGYHAERAYSIASPPEAAAVEITVERVDGGEVSPFLVDEVRLGDELELRGPVGGYFAWQVADGGPLVLLGGGSGMVPLISMLRHRAARESDVEAHVLVSARTAADVLFRDELDGYAGAGVDVRVTLTRAWPDDWAGWTGRVDRERLEIVVPAAAREPRVFVCGPTGFVEHVAALLVELGHDPHAIRTERFGPTGG
jgi:ferredoxin-NADP reductase